MVYSSTPHSPGDYSSIKPIETRYNGYRFRSRLEARWAVFFDALHIPYQYEVEGYDLAGRWYLPDFWLPNHHCWVEIKPTGTDPYNERCMALALATNGRVLNIIGDPWLFGYEIIVYEGFEDGGSLIEGCQFAAGRRSPGELWVADVDGSAAICLNPLDDSDRWPDLINDRLRDAYVAARQARFEQRR